MTPKTSQEAGCSPRRLSPSDLRRFAPHHLARTHDEEIGYRRGFDQGVAAMAYALGIDNDVLQRLAWKQRVTAFRRGDVSESPMVPTAEERAELHRLLSPPR